MGFEPIKNSFADYSQTIWNAIKIYCRLSESNRILNFFKVPCKIPATPKRLKVIVRNLFVCK